MKNNFDLDTKQLHHLESYITVTLCRIKLCPDILTAADTCCVHKILTTFCFEMNNLYLVVNLGTVACITCLWSNSVTSLCVWQVQAELLGTPCIAFPSWMYMMHSTTADNSIAATVIYII